MSRVVKLEELCLPDQIGKYGIPAVAEEFSEDKVRYLRITDIDDYGNLLENDKKSVSSPEIEKYILKEGDIVFARTGNSTGRTYYHEEKNGELAFAGFLIKFSLDESKVNPKYLKYFTISKPYKQWVDNLSNGSTRGNINAKTFADCPIILPSREQQDYLVRVLSSLEDKIQINNQINQELESIAKTLYDYWFVQFDFPDQNGKPYKSSGGKMVYNPELKREIPEGWGVEKLSSLLEIGRETINPMKNPKEEFKYYSIPEYDVSGSFSYEFGETIKSNKFIVEKSDLLVSKLNPWFNRVVYNIEESAISSTEFIVWKTFNRFEKNFLYQVATSEGFIEYCTRFATGTSNSHKRVSPDIMVGFQIPFEKTYIQNFGEITDSIRTQVLQNNVQNQELTQLRDWLLPMLMNGQVKVE
ncbi:restriction endonuclease subunit S [Streptococcus salivarius]